MKGERDPRRREIADTIVRMGDMLGIQAVIYDAGRAGTEKQRRAPCLEALVEDAAKHDQAKIVFDLVAATCSSNSAAIRETCDFDSEVILSVATSLSIRRVDTPSK